MIQADDRVVEAIRAQTPLLARYPQSQAAESVAKLARQFRPPKKALAG